MRRRKDSIFDNRYNMNNIENKNLIVSLEAIDDKYGIYDNELNILYNKINEIVINCNIKKITKTKYREMYYYVYNLLVKENYKIMFNDLEIFVAICNILGIDYLKMLLVLDSSDVINIFNCLKHLNLNRICKILF